VWCEFSELDDGSGLSFYHGWSSPNSDNNP
jgi:hypothetical protein